MQTKKTLTEHSKFLDFGVGEGIMVVLMLVYKSDTYTSSQSMTCVHCGIYKCTLSKALLIVKHHTPQKSEFRKTVKNRQAYARYIVSRDAHNDQIFK